MAASDFDIVICETRLVPSICDAELTPSGWMLFSRDRHSNDDAIGFGGGVIVLVRNELRPIEVSSAGSLISPKVVVVVVVVVRVVSPLYPLLFYYFGQLWSTSDNSGQFRHL